MCFGLDEMECEGRVVVEVAFEGSSTAVVVGCC